ncbi:MAG: glycine--tRNA ligase subunit beta, partial [Alphaproteobacteria bacterium]|nr:glycine--tRNA ligase subunit beta [Alphaproteobacteria bacterium]
KPEIAQAIAEHYKPVGANDTCPTAPVSIAVALADKLDALVGFFAIDEKPTGSKDPFALRRAALGVIRIILENKLRVSLTMLFQKSYQLYGGKIKGLRPEADVTKDLTQFFTERLKVALKDQGVRHDLIDAVFAAKADDDLTRVVARVNAVQDFVKTEDGANLLAGYKRATNILRIEEKKDGKSYSGKDVKESLLAEEQEKNLFAALGASGGKIKADLAKEDYKAVMSGMSGIRSAVDAFFDKILVNAPDAGLRANRLSMLASIAGTMNEVADFSKLEG